MLHELDGYIPAHDLSEATAGVVVAGKRPARVALTVTARGWRAELQLCVHRPALREADYQTQELYYAAYHAERREAEQEFTEPMLACLRNLAKAGPLALSAIEDPWYREPTNYVPRRRAIPDDGGAR